MPRGTYFLCFAKESKQRKATLYLHRLRRFDIKGLKIQVNHQEIISMYCQQGIVDQWLRLNTSMHFLTRHSGLRGYDD